MITTVSDKEIAQAATIEQLRQEITAWAMTAENLEAELERERIRLAACGVVAMSDTPDSAIEARQMLSEYESASCDDVKRRVDECMALRAERDALKKSVMQMTNYWLYERGQGGCEPLDSQIVWADALKADAARYQWLLSNAYVGIAPFPKPHEVWCTKLPNPAGCNCLDAAIDAAMKDQS